jgi:asparagine synthetase B (glutamine-hydrolysing)
MLFIPVYYTTLKYSKEKAHVIGTHNDVTAKAAGRETDIDFTSVTDMLLNSSIVFPYTFHEGVFQLFPAAIYNYGLNNPEEETLPDTYWRPVEQHIFKNINEAAFCLRESLLTTVEQITDGLSEVGLFLTGGEDTRVILSAIPKDVKKEALVFLDSLNREGEIARRTANVHKISLKTGIRLETYYLDNMKAAIALLGSQFNFTQLHTYMFHSSLGLTHYPAVLGGFGADGLIKGEEIPVKTFKAGKHILFSSLLQGSAVNSNSFNTSIFSSNFVEEVNMRHQNHSRMVQNFRECSFNEWKNYWPITNKEFYANFAGNRRLFRSFEPILHTSIIKILASVPQEWKINRRLFHKAFKPLLKKTWQIPHSEKCYFPYFGTVVNIPLRLFEAGFRKINKEKYTGNQGPWARWDDVAETALMRTLLIEFADFFYGYSRIFNNNVQPDLYKANILNSKQKLMFLQLLYLKSANVFQLA